MADKPFTLGSSVLGKATSVNTEVSFQECWTRALRGTDWLPWKAEAVTGPIGALATFGAIWARSQTPNLKAFLDTAQFWDFALPIVIGFVVALIITPAASFTKNLAGARSDILISRIHGVAKDNQRLASMLAVYEHPKKETHDLLVSLANEGRKVRDFWVRAIESLAGSHTFQYPAVETLVHQYNAWQSECETQLAPPRLRYNDYHRIIDLRPVLPTDLRGFVEWGAPKYGAEILRALEQKIQTLDGLIGGEYSPPHGIFWNAEQWSVAQKYLPTPSASHTEEPDPTGAAS